MRTSFRSLLVPFLLALALGLTGLSTGAGAVEPDEILADPVLEKRARDLSQELRCVVCQNQNIDNSNAGIAKTMRILVRERITLGDTDQEVKDYLVARYGDYVLLKPPFKISTVLLWVGPAVILLLGIVAVISLLRRQRASRNNPNEPTAAPLSADEESRLARLMDETSAAQDRPGGRHKHI